MGDYTLKMAEHVASTGRVFSLEPVPATFDILSRIIADRFLSNVTLLNLAASDTFEEVSITVPLHADGIPNYYQARIGNPKWANHAIKVFAVPIDSVEFVRRIALVKIDAEGYDSKVLSGARALICRDRPVLILESLDAEGKRFLLDLGYEYEKFPGSPNLVFLPPSRQADA